MGSTGRRLSAVLLCVLAGGDRRALALNSSVDVAQYAHNAWRIRAGLFPGVPLSITPPPDGYLGLGTELGLIRFDGVRPAAWTPPGGQRLPSDRIRTLLTARDGT